MKIPTQALFRQFRCQRLLSPRKTLHAAKQSERTNRRRGPQQGMASRSCGLVWREKPFVLLLTGSADLGFTVIRQVPLQNIMFCERTCRSCREQCNSCDRYVAHRPSSFMVSRRYEPSEGALTASGRCTLRKRFSSLIRQFLFLRRTRHTSGGSTTAAAMA